MRITKLIAHLLIEELENKTGRPVEEGFTNENQVIYKDVKKRLINKLKDYRNDDRRAGEPSLEQIIRDIRI